jgi:hypothetical protein
MYFLLMSENYQEQYNTILKVWLFKYDGVVLKS